LISKDLIQQLLISIEPNQATLLVSNNAHSRRARSQADQPIPAVDRSWCANLLIYRLLEPLLLLCNIPPKSAHVIGLS
jgi:hypothetical protein